MRRAIASSLLLVACGAKTGLRIPDSSVDAPVDTGVDAPVCVPPRGPLAPETAELMLVLDRSNSMAFTLDGTQGQPQDQWRWTIMQSALDVALASINPRVHVGAKFFPDPQMPPASTMMACTATGPVDVQLGPSATTAPRIISIFANTLPGGGTPTASALQVAATAFSVNAPRRFILLATDGAPNCNAALPQNTCRCTSPPVVCQGPDPGPYSCLDDTRTIGELDRLFSRGIPTYVVGIADPSFSDVLDAMAVAGGRPRMIPGQPAFYDVTSAAQLQQALMSITQSIPACIFSAPVPPANARFSIEFDGVTVSQDATNGWTWLDRAAGQLEFHGAACTNIASASRIEYVADTCPR